MLENGRGRWVIVVAAVAILTGCGGRPKAGDDGGRVEIDGRQVDLKQLQRDVDRAEKAALKGTRPLAPIALQGLLPATVDGYVRSDVKTETGPEPGMTVASARYVKGGAAFVLKVTDLGAIGAVGAGDDDVGAETVHRTATGYEKITTAGGRMVSEQWDDASKAGRYSVVAADRFSISAEGAAERIEVLRAAVETVNAARLRALSQTF